MEVVGEPLFEVDCEPSVEEVKERVDKRSRNCYKSKVEDSLDKNRFVFFDDGLDNFTV
jgi:hypothetical protein